ncbi:hypothetical protein EC973_004430 [Apophysomyces ossiformis]|uniref:Uncharacterized protein n=1 Tax=Apophysomyces ossiformis TaxID=679940 RepID=A0A8H7BSF8_9FUNG|nr:hypothetical protein EC973_004430 [Apophysomyces ossiformis]
MLYFLWSLCLLFFFFITTQAIPLHCPDTTTDCATSDTESFDVNTDHFAQLVATHWQFDHLETIISSTCKEIADMLQNHIHISTTEIQPLSGEPQPQHAMNIELMDAEILQAQISGAIQAHTQGKLPLIWDNLAEQLGRPAMEEHVRQMLTSHCPESSRQTVDSHCLMDKAAQISSLMDRYVANHLGHIFEILDQRILPELLDHTAKDLQEVLNYFNIAFLQQENRHFSLTVSPWSTKPNTNMKDQQQQQQQQRPSLKSHLLSLVAQSMVSQDYHPTAFITDYAQLARA